MAAREGDEPAAASEEGLEIRGRLLAPGRAREGCGAGTRDEAVVALPAVAGETGIGEEARAAKRRRTEESSETSGNGQHVSGETNPRSCQSDISHWSSRRALLASLRAGVRPPEGLT